MKDNNFQARLDMALEQFALAYLHQPLYGMPPNERLALSKAMEAALRAADMVREP